MADRAAYLNLIGGASGDMLLGALIDAGLELESLREELAKLRVGGYSLRAERVLRGVIPATLLHVDLDEEGERRRGIDDFRRVVGESDLPEKDRQLATRVFDALGRAEDAVHGAPGVLSHEPHEHEPAHAHSHAESHAHAAESGELHELATVDTLVDVVGVIAGLRLLGIERVHSSPFPAGSGLTATAHGPLPSPAPATMQIYAAANAPLRTYSAEGPTGEAVTPTGAAIVTTVASFDPVDIAVNRVGYGAGSRNSAECPNVLALWLGEVSGTRPTGDLSLLETNIDDTTGELLGYVQERLFEAGAWDVWVTPIQMKKNRPASMISALVDAGRAQAAAELILRETSTLGVRVRPVERYEADREIIDVDTSLGRLPVKVKRVGDHVQVSAEYEACRRVARETDLPLAEVMRRVAEEARDFLLKQDGR